jgi:hypothetical protein
MKKEITNLYIVKSWTIILLLSVFCVNYTSGQTAGDYRTFQGGSWSSTSTWERYNGSSWVNPAPSAPTSSDGTITIRTTHTVNVTADVTVDQLVINNSTTAILNINSGVTLTLANGTGNDLTFSSGLNNAKVNVTGILKVENDAAFSGATSSRLVILSGGKLQWNYTSSSGTLPTANWNTGSTVEFTGYTSNTTTPSNISQSFYNFIWNCAAQENSIDLNGAVTNILGSLTVSNTNGNHLILSDATGYTLNIAGNLNVTNSGQIALNFTSATAIVNITGNLVYSSTGESYIAFDGNATVNITGNMTVSDPSSTIYISGGAGNGTINIHGNFLYTNGFIDNTGSGTAAINFNGNTTQTYSAPSSFSPSGAINYTIKTLATVDMGTSAFAGTGTFTIESGATLNVGSTHSSGAIQANTSNGNIRVPSGNRTFTNGSTLVYNGTSAQALGDGFPPSPTAVNLTINNSNGVSVTGANTTINASSTLTLTSGSLIIGSNTLNIDGYIAGTGTLTGSGTSNLVINGVTADDVGTIRFSSGAGAFLNNLTLNRSAGSATLGTDLTVNTTLALTNGNLIFNGHTLTLIGNATGTGNLSGDASSSLIINGTGAFGSVSFIGGGNSIANLTVNRASSGTATIGSALTVNTALLLTNGALTTSGTLTMASGSTLTRASGTISTTPTFAGTSDIIYTSPVTTGNELPTSSTAIRDLTINCTSSSVVLNADVTVTRNLTITSGTLSTGSNRNITLKGNWVNNAFFTPNSGTVTFSGTSGQNISGSLATTFYNLTVNNSSNVTLSGTSITTTVSNNFTCSSGSLSIGANTLALTGFIPIASSLIGGSTSNLSIGGSGDLGTITFASSPTLLNLTLNRASSGQATLGTALTVEGVLTLTLGTLNSDGYLTMNLVTGYISGTGTGAISGNITTTKTIDRSGYSYIGAPVINSAVTFPAPLLTLYYYDELLHDRNGTTDAGWKAISSTINVSAANIMRGYSGYYTLSSTNISMTGTYAHTSDYSITVTRTSGSGDASSENGINLIANPFPSALDWTLVDRSTNGVANELHYYNGSGYTSYVGSFPSGGNEIPPMQSVFIWKSSGTSDVLTFPKSARLEKTKSLLRTGADESLKNALKISSSDGKHLDEAYIRFTPGATASYDMEYDAHKFYNDEEAHSIYTVGEGTDLYVNSLSDSLESNSIPIKILSAKKENIALNFSQYYPIDHSIGLELYDPVNKVTQDLRIDSTYEVSVLPNDTVNARLYINFIQAVAGIENALQKNVSAHTKDNMVTVNFKNIMAKNATISMNDMLGHELFKIENTDISVGSYTFPVSRGLSGIYLVKIHVGDIVYLEKMFINN